MTTATRTRSFRLTALLTLLALVAAFWRPGASAAASPGADGAWTILAVGRNATESSQLRDALREARDRLHFKEADVSIMWTEAATLDDGARKRLGITPDMLPCVAVVAGSAGQPLGRLAGDPPALFARAHANAQTGDMMVGRWAEIASRSLPTGFELSGEAFRPKKLVALIVGKLPQDYALAETVAALRQSLQVDTKHLPILFTTYQDGLLGTDDFHHLGVTPTTSLPYACIARVGESGRPAAAIAPSLSGFKDAQVAACSLLAIWAKESGLPAVVARAEKAFQKRASALYYERFLKNPGTLGFSPDATMFAAIYQRIQTVHPDTHTDAALFGGVLAEVGSLLEEAKIPAAGLKSLKADDTAPEHIAGEYGGQVDTHLLWFAMIRGLMRGTDDPYSSLETPDDLRHMMESLGNARFGGIGIFIELDTAHQDRLTVVEPIEGSPADKAGLLPGDQILKIDGKATDGMSLELASSAIRGPVGGKVVLTICHPPQSTPLEIAIQRGQIETPSITQKMLPGGIAYIRLRMFGTNTGRDFSAALDVARQSKARALILDVRNNTGGFVDAAVSVCSHFVPRDGIIVTFVDKRGSRSEFHSTGESPVGMPAVVLINKFSASASEITAGCLKDYKLATLAGVKSFGKGCAQKLYPLPGNAALRLTTNYILTPRDFRYHKLGIEPDVKIEGDPRQVGRGKVEDDKQVKAAMDILAGRARGTAAAH